MRQSILTELNEETVEKILKRLRRLNWDDKTTTSMIIDYLSRPWLVSFSNVQFLASLLAGLTFYYDWVGHTVVDNVLEEQRLGLEVE